MPTMMDMFTMETIAQIRRDEYESTAARQRIADQLPHQTLASFSGALRGLQLQVLSAIGLLTQSI